MSRESELRAAELARVRAENEGKVRTQAEAEAEAARIKAEGVPEVATS